MNRLNGSEIVDRSGLRPAGHEQHHENANNYGRRTADERFQPARRCLPCIYLLPLREARRFDVLRRAGGCLPAFGEDHVTRHQRLTGVDVFERALVGVRELPERFDRVVEGRARDQRG